MVGVLGPVVTPVVVGVILTVKLSVGSCTKSSMVVPLKHWRNGVSASPLPAGKVTVRVKVDAR